MSHSLRIEPGRVGLLVSAYAMASAVAAVPSVAVIGRLPRRPVLVAVLAGVAGCDAVTAISSSFVLTLAVRIVAGLLGGVIWAMLAPLAARLGQAGSDTRSARATSALDLRGSALDRR